jgi:hypothetical protein
MLGSTIALIAAVTPFALPPLIPILLLFYFIYLYFQVHTPRTPTHMQTCCQSVYHGPAHFVQACMLHSRPRLQVA